MVYSAKYVCQNFSIIFIIIIVAVIIYMNQTDRHPFNGLFSRTTQESRYQKGKIILDFNEARDDGMSPWK